MARGPSLQDLSADRRWGVKPLSEEARGFAATPLAESESQSRIQRHRVKRREGRSRGGIEKSVASYLQPIPRRCLLLS